MAAERRGAKGELRRKFRPAEETSQRSCLAKRLGNGLRGDQIVVIKVILHMGGRPGIKEVAKACGLSIATVSHALNGRGRVAPDTVARVRTCALKLGYAPNAHAAMMARRRGRTRLGVELAVLTSSAGPGEAPFKELRTDFLRRAQMHGFRVSVYETSTTEDAVRICGRLVARGVDGVFFPAVREFLEIPPEVLARLSVVVLGRHHRLARYHSVHHEVFDSTREACLGLVARGYRRIMPILVPHEPPLEDDWERWSAVESVRAELGADGPVWAPVMRPRSAKVSPLVKEARPDAVIAFNDLEFHKLNNNGVKIPEEVGFVGLHVYDLRLAGFYLSPEVLAEAALETMALLIRRQERGMPEFPHHLRLARRWNEGTTLRIRA